MKKFLAIILTMSMLLLAGCSTPDSSGNSSPSGSDIPDSSYTSSVSQTGTGKPWKVRIPRKRALKTPLMRHPCQTEMVRTMERTTRVPESPKGQPRNLSLATFQKKPFLRSHLVMTILQRVQSPL